MTTYDPPPPDPGSEAPFNPYKPPTAQVADVSTSSPGDLSSRRRRLGAQMINGLLMMVAGIPWFVGFMITVFELGEEALLNMGPFDAYDPTFYQAGGTLAVVLVSITLVLTLALIAVNLVLLTRSAQSIGKRLVGIRIQRTDGTQPSIWRLLFLRYIPVALVSYIPVLGFLIALVNYGFILSREKRCGHDLLADTRVVRV